MRERLEMNDKKITIREVAERTGNSPASVWKNVRMLIKVLPRREQMIVMEHMLVCRRNDRRKMR